MVARVGTVAFQGIDVLDVDVQVEMTSGLPAFHIVGLGVLPVAIHTAAQSRSFVCAHNQGGEAVWAGDLDVIAAKDLLSLINHVKGTHVQWHAHVRNSEYE